MNDVEEVKSRIDIVEVVGGYVQLKQAGRNFKGLSPFKSEKTPSFMVSAEKNIWHDFSSGKGGDVISFVMEMEGVSFPEALEMLAKRAGVQLKPRTKSKFTESSNRSQLYEINELAMKFYHLALSKSVKAKDYLFTNRRLTTETVKRFRIGYAPDSWDSLSQYLLKQGYSQTEIIAAGVAAKGQKTGSKGYDIFRGRVMFPIFDMQNRVIGFSARILDESVKAAKYINTPQTDIYNKSLAIYGLAQAKEAIRHSGQVIIVEGNMDVLALHDAGFANVVACSGTALTEQQLRILSRLTKQIYLALDQDSAGVAAAQRAIETALPLNIRLHVVTYAGAKDPDELIKKDKKLWPTAIKSAAYAPDYLLDFAKSKYDTRSAVGKKDFVAFLLPMLRAITDEIEFQHYVKKVAQTVDSSEVSIQKLLKTTYQGKSVPNESTVSAQPEHQNKRSLTKLEKLEQELLELLLVFEVPRVALEDINLKQISKLHQPIFEELIKSPKVELAKLTELLPAQSNYVRILALRGEQNFAGLSAHDKRLEAFTQVQRINTLQKELNKRRLAKQVADAEALKDTKKAKILLRQYQALLDEE